MSDFDALVAVLWPGHYRPEDVAHRILTSDWLAAHDDRARAAERERIATAIEAMPIDSLPSGFALRNNAARLARNPEEGTP